MRKIIPILLSMFMLSSCSYVDKFNNTVSIVRKSSDTYLKPIILEQMKDGRDPVEYQKEVDSMRKEVDSIKTNIKELSDAFKSIGKKVSK